MLNEFKRPMWTDGPAKQPWLNYYNSYERMHSCFGDADTDTSGYGEETGMTAAQAAEVAAAMDAAKDARASVEGQQAAGDVAAADAQGIDVSEVDSGMSRADASLTDIDTLEDLGLIGYNERDALGYFDKLDAQSRADDQRIANEIFVNQSALGRDVNVTVDKDGNFVYGGKDAFSAFGDQAGKFGKTVGGGLADIYKNTSVLGLLGNIPDIVKSVANVLNKSPNDVNEEDIRMVTGGQNYGGLREEDITPTQVKDSGIAGPDINPILAGGATDFSSGGYDGPTINITNLPTLDELDLIKESRAELDAGALNIAKERNRDTNLINNYDDAMVNRSSSGFGDVRGYSSPSLPTLGGDFNAMQNQANLENIISAYEETERARSREGNQLGRDIAAYEEAEEAMFGGRNAGQPEVMAFGPEVDQDDPRIIKPNQVVAAAAEPKKSAFNMLLDRINQPSTSYSSNVTTDTPMTQQDMTQQVMTTNPFEIAKQRARMARATLGNYNVNIGRAADALQSFEGNTDTITPFALATLMANQPKDSQTYNENIRKLGGRGPLQPTTFALGGGGLRSLMEYS